MEATRVLVSVKPEPGMVSVFDVLEAVRTGNVEYGVWALTAVLENVEAAHAARLEELERNVL